MGKGVTLGILGTGRIGRLHLANLVTRVPGARVAAVADVMLDSAREAAHQFGIADVSRDPRQVIENRDIDAVLICSSTNTHADLIVAAAAAGKHIFCEKPISLDLRETDRALAAVREAGVKLQMGFNRRFDPNHARLERRIREGQIGDIHSLRIASRDPAPPPMEYVKVSGGIFADMTIHDFDMARFLLAEEPEEVYAVGSVLIDRAIGEIGDYDSAMVVLRFASGAVVTIDNSRKAVYGYDQRIEAFGSKGMAISENVRPNTTRLYTEEAVSEDLPPYFFLERYTESYLREMDAFLKVIRENVEPPAGGADARQALRLAFAARKSAAENRPVLLREI